MSDIRSNDIRSNDTQNNGGELPPAREAIIDQAQRVHQEVAHERDLLRREVADLKIDLAASKVVTEATKAQAEQAVEAMQTQLALADSKVAQARIEWEAMHDQLAVYRVLFQSFGALWRAFEIEHAPLIRMMGMGSIGEGTQRQQPGYNESRGAYQPMEGGL